MIINDRYFVVTNIFLYASLATSLHFTVYKSRKRSDLIHHLILIPHKQEAHSQVAAGGAAAVGTLSFGERQ